MINISDYAEDYEFERFDGLTIKKSDIREDIINYYIDAQINGNTRITDLNKGSEAYHLCDLLSELMMDIYGLINDKVSNLLIHEATGEVLDNYGDMRGVYRIGGSPSLLSLTLTRKDGVSGDITIYDGTSLLTDDSLSFIIDVDDDYIIIPSDEDEVIVEALCIYDGVIGNISGDVNFIIEDDNLINKVTVTDYEVINLGVDDEDDDDYRIRIIESPNNYPIGSVGWYENSALDTSNDGSPNIVDCKVEFGELLGNTNKSISIWFKPSDYGLDGMVDENDDPSVLDLPIEYLEDNNYGESINSPRRLYKGRKDLIYLFTQDKYIIINHELRFKISDTELISDVGSELWQFRIILDDGYSLNNELIQKIRSKAQEYINNLKINESFVPYLMNESVKEVEGVLDCKIFNKATDTEVYNSIEVTDEHNSIYADTGYIDVVEGVS